MIINNGQDPSHGTGPNLSLFFLRLLIVEIFVILLSFCLLGIAFPLISRITGTDYPFPNLRRYKLEWWSKSWLAFRILLGMAMALVPIWAGLKMLIESGFLGQNLIYLLSR